MVGGNAFGIFVHAVLADSPASSAGLCPGDRILEYNGVDVRRATAEQAAFELAKPANKVTLLVKHDFISKFLCLIIKNKKYIMIPLLSD